MVLLCSTLDRSTCTILCIKYTILFLVSHILSDFYVLIVIKSNYFSSIMFLFVILIQPKEEKKSYPYFYLFSLIKAQRNRTHPWLFFTVTRLLNTESDPESQRSEPRRSEPEVKQKNSPTWNPKLHQFWKNKTKAANWVRIPAGRKPQSVALWSAAYLPLLPSHSEPSRLGLTPSPKVDGVKSCSSQRLFLRMLTVRPLAHSIIHVLSSFCQEKIKKNHRKLWDKKRRSKLRLLNWKKLNSSLICVFKNYRNHVKNHGGGWVMLGDQRRGSFKKIQLSLSL